MSETHEAFPLFPLGIVVLPSELVPLHIFEERYKTMIGECLDEDREFGIVWAAEDGLHEVGCTVSISELLERTEDGRMNIVTRGSRPFRLLRRIDDMPYPAGDIELLDDDDEKPDAAAAEAAHERYAELIERVTDSRPDPDELDGLGAYAMAATVEFPLPAKQELLELRSEDERMHAVGALLEAAMKQLDLVQLADERARSNGRVRAS